MGVRVPSLLPLHLKGIYMKRHYRQVSEETQRLLFKVWFTNNCIQRDGQSAIEDLIDDYQSYNFTAIDVEMMKILLNEYNIVVENGCNKR